MMDFEKRPSVETVLRCISVLYNCYIAQLDTSQSPPLLLTVVLVTILAAVAKLWECLSFCEVFHGAALGNKAPRLHTLRVKYQGMSVCTRWLTRAQVL